MARAVRLARRSPAVTDLAAGATWRRRVRRAHGGMAVVCRRAERCAEARRVGEARRLMDSCRQESITYADSLVGLVAATAKPI